MKLRPALVLSLTSVGVLIAATPAQANTDAWRECSAVYLDGIHGPVTGASGGGNENLKNSTTLTDVNLTVKDTRADGHHVAIRLVTRRSDGTDHNWPWHGVYSGAATSDSWFTTATDSGGIKLVWREVAVFEGDSKLGSCVTTPQAN
ncbi:hypothetical protein AB0N99_23510 [Streptomyces sp. NPDC093272]|uniref:hypothetical protein n=1 Tax=unclassified Streptomyces TaxID=2593676 RepID=UPI0034193F1F